MYYKKFIKKLTNGGNLYAHVIYVDIDTGELIQERDVVLRIYRVVTKKTITIKPLNNETTRIIETTNRCRRNESTQTTIFKMEQNTNTEHPVLDSRKHRRRV